MATNFQPKSDIQVIVGTGSANLGSAHLVGDTWTKLHVTDYSIEHASAPLDVAPQRSGSYGQTESMGHHRPDTQSYEVSLTMRGTPSAVLTCSNAMWGDGSSPLTLTAEDSTGSMKDGTSNSSAVTLLFENTGSDSTQIDLVMKSCFCTGLTLKEDVGTNGGELIVDATFWTAYRPEETTLAPTGGGVADEDNPKNIFNLTTKTLGGFALILTSWELNISRSLERVSFQDTTDYDPFGYVQTSPYEVTGTISAKRDDSIYDLVSAIKGDSTGIALSLAESSGFTLNCPDVMIDNSKPEVGEYLMQSIPFRAFGENEDDNIVSITIS